MIHFVGAGPGATDLITVRGADLLARADLVIYAGSLVNSDLLARYCRADAEVRDSSRMTLEEVLAALTVADAAGREAVRLHTGDPSLYGAIREQMDALDRAGIAYDVTPGVSALSGAAAALQAEYTLPAVSQSVIITRMEGRTPVPAGEKLADLSCHGCTMVLFLSAGLLDRVQKELLRGAYAADTPAAIVYKATWPEERVVRCTVGTLAAAGRDAGIDRTALIAVGDFLGASYDRSQLYNPAFETSYRQATTQDEGTGASDGRA